MTRKRSRPTTGRKLLFSGGRGNARGTPPLFASQAQLAKCLLATETYRDFDSHSIQSYLSQVLSGAPCSWDLANALLAVVRQACERQGRQAEPVLRELAGFLRPDDSSALLDFVPSVGGREKPRPGRSLSQQAGPDEPHGPSPEQDGGFATSLRSACELDLNLTHPDEAVALLAGDAEWQSFLAAMGNPLWTRILVKAGAMQCVQAMLDVMMVQGRWTDSEVRTACFGSSHRVRFLAVPDEYWCPMPFVLLRDAVTGERSGFLPATALRRLKAPPVVIAPVIANDLHQSCFVSIEGRSEGKPSRFDFGEKVIEDLLKGDSGIYRIDAPGTGRAVSSKGLRPPRT